MLIKFTFASGAALMLTATPAMAQATFDEDGITIGDDDTNVNIGGRIHLDGVSVSDDVTPFRDRVDLRRFRVDATVTVAEDFRFKVDADIAGTSTGFRNVWASYSGIDNVIIKAGNFIAPVAGENMMSSNNIKLMERSLASTLAPSFLLGGAVTYRGSNWSATGGYFFDPIEQNPLRPADVGESIAARFVVAPIRERKEVLHFAVGLENRDLDPGSVSRVSARPEFGLDGTTLTRTGSLTGVDSYTNYNVEAAYMNGPFLVKGNYIVRDNSAPTLGDPNFNGGSVEAAWVITGERQRYGMTNGTFGAIRPRGDLGAVEVAARYSFLDLNDALVTGGEEQNWSVGVNWYITRNVRVMGNYVHAKTTPGRNGLRESVDAVMTRFQIAF
ncbi:MAG: hypothetical protein COW29_07625 [Rhodobacterales bacterium CG15_BIG_FIL_POST_REV_8_21_14_020_59_13]|nr:porin [Sphingomonadales bacterium]NCP26024.1 porin [Sphingomonadales bacterium]NCP48620.1 porin [Sphingomonadales bacterium]NCQ20177.1 porin [Sphingomonadales bacterium]PIW29022.1 MAG: hypothetical protein COW29_07625 [Rhodobacterales bacterium CG15_BIG_FIL_POST_REV_8_21_14_020_59_13]